MKKIIMIIVLAVFLASLFADGVQPLGSGTQEDPYRVSTLNNLLWISTNQQSWDKYFVQTADIDAYDTINWNDGEGFIPIGTYEVNFTGSYNGNNHIIEGLYINRDEFEQGFFGYCYTEYGVPTKIENLGLVNVNISGLKAVGALAGYTRTDIDNCFSSGVISTSIFNGGGLVGENAHLITNSYSSCTVTGGSAVGGLVGKNLHSVKNSYSTGDVAGTADTGGFVGINEYNVENCFSRGNVIKLSYDTSIAGFCGTSVNSYIWLCYSTGSVTRPGGTSPSDRGFLGEIMGNTNGFFSNFFDNELSNQQTDGLNAAIAKNTIEMKTVSTFTDEWWDFVGESENGDDDFWDIDFSINNGYPHLVYFYQGPQMDSPQNLSITISDMQITLSWDEVQNATSYKVYSSSSPYENFIEDNTGIFTGNMWIAPIPQNSNTKFYKVSAISE